LQDFDQAKYDALPKYYKEKITESSEWRGSKAKEADATSYKPVTVDLDEDIMPF
jgi:hypothetical protein